jgi:hypothetical protein
MNSKPQRTGPVDEQPTSKLQLQLPAIPRERVQANWSLASDLLDRMEHVLQSPTEPDSTPDLGPSIAREDRQYLLSKIVQIRVHLERLRQRLEMRQVSSTVQQVLNAGLLCVYVLFENCRPERFGDAGINIEQTSRYALEEGVAELALQVMNMRARLR